MNYVNLFGQVNSIDAKTFKVKQNSIDKDFKFVKDIFIKTGKDLQAGINGAKISINSAKKTFGC